MNNFHKCVNYKPCTDCIIISCKLGLWSVTGDYTIETARKAEKLYQTARDAGKYINLPKEKTHANSIKIRSKS